MTATTPAAAPFSFAPPVTTPAPPPKKNTKTKKPSKPIKKPKESTKKQQKKDRKNRPVKYKKPSKSFFKNKAVPPSLTYGGSEKSSKRAPQPLKVSSPKVKVSPKFTLKESSGVTFKSLVGVERDPGQQKVEVPTLISPVPLKEAELREESIVKVPRPTSPKSSKSPISFKSPKSSTKPTKKKSQKKGNLEKSKKIPKPFKLEENPRESGVTFKAWVGVKTSSGTWKTSGTSSDDNLNEISSASRRRPKAVRERPPPGRRRGRRGKKGSGSGRGRSSKHPRRRSRPPPRRRHDP